MEWEVSLVFPGIYLKMEEKIIKIKQPQAVQGLLGVRSDDNSALLEQTKT